MLSHRHQPDLMLVQQHGMHHSSIGTHGGLSEEGDGKVSIRKWDHRMARLFR